MGSNLYGSFFLLSTLCMLIKSCAQGRMLLVGYLVGEQQRDFVNGLPLPAFVMFRFLRFVLINSHITVKWVASF